MQGGKLQPFIRAKTLPIFMNLRKIMANYKDLQVNVRSTAGQLEAAQNAGRLYPWPLVAGPTPDEKTLQIFNGLQEYRAFLDWQPVDILDLAGLAQMHTNATALLRKLTAEGYVVYGGRTGLEPRPNPAAKLHMNLVATINAVSRRIGITTMSVSQKNTRSSRAKAERDAARNLGGETQADPFDRSKLM